MSILISVVIHEERCWRPQLHVLLGASYVACYVIYHLHEALVLEICLIDLRLSLL